MDQDNEKDDSFSQTRMSDSRQELEKQSPENKSH